jgi:hypothetical protein
MVQTMRVTWLHENIENSLSGLHKYSIAGPHGGDPKLRLVEVDVGETNTIEHDLRGALLLGLGDARLGPAKVKVMVRQSEFWLSVFNRRH